MQEREVEANFWRGANLVREIARKSLFDRAERAVVIQFVAEAERLASPKPPEIHGQRLMHAASREDGARSAAE
jgi:hypothetical protein